MYNHKGANFTTSSVSFVVFFLFCFCIFCFAQTQEEKLTLTTYYPAPYGAYQQLLTNTLGVGDSDGDGGLDSGDAPSPTANPGDVWIKGKVGIGTGTAGPTANLHVAGNDGAVFTGTLDSGTIPVAGAGTRLMWYPGKAAFRAGIVGVGGSVHDDDWDDGNTGYYSVAMGCDTIASGVGSTAMGYQTTASGTESTAMGYATTATGMTSTAIGRAITVTGINSVGIGLDTTARTVATDNVMAIVGGKVGIGTVDPGDQLLNVDGNAFFSWATMYNGLVQNELEVTGNLKADSNTPDGCGWLPSATTWYNTDAAGQEISTTCTGGRFLAGIAFKGGAGADAVEELDQWRIYCCDL